MRFARLASIALLAAVALPAGGQSLSSLPRSTRSTGLNDSTLLMVADSARRTRAAVLPDFRKALSLSAFDSLFPGKLKLQGSTVTGSATWSNLQTFAANQRVDSATGAARAQILTTARTIGGTSFNGSGNIVPGLADSSTGSARSPASGLLGNTLAAGVTASSLTSFGSGARTDSATGAARASALVGSPAITVSSCTGCGGGTTYPLAATNGSASAPSIAFANSTGLGLYRVGPDTLGIAASGRFAAMVRDSQLLAVKGRAGQPAYSFNIAATTGVSIGSSSELLLVNGGSTKLQIFSSQTISSNQFRQSAGGTASAPSYTFDSDGNNGLYRISNSIGFAATGRQVAAMADSQLKVVKGRVDRPSYSFIEDSASIGMYRFGADTLGFASAGAHSIGIRGGASPTIFGGAGNLTLQCGTGNSRSCTVQVTNASGTPTTALQLNGGATQTATYAGTFGVGAGTVSIPGLNNSGGSTGIYWPGSDTLSIANSGAIGMRICCSGGAGTTWIGGTGTDLFIRAGSAASAKTTLQTMTSGSAIKNTLTLGADTSVALLSGAKLLLDGTGGNTFINNTSGSDSLQFTVAGSQGPRFSGDGRVLWGGGGTVANPALRWNQGGHVYGFSVTNAGAPDTVSITVDGSAIARWVDNHATAAGDVAVCITTTNVITKGATCGSSSAKVKTDIAGLLGSTATSRTMSLRPTSYSYRPWLYDGRSEFGLIAGEAAKVDRRFAFYADRDDSLPDGEVIRKGEAINVNDRAILANLIATVQDMKRQSDSTISVLSIRVDSLRSELAKVKKP